MVASSHRAETIVMQNFQPRIRFIPGDERVHRGREKISAILSTERS